MALQLSLSLCHDLGFRIADHKVDAPSTCIPFLGILIGQCTEFATRQAMSPAGRDSCVGHSQILPQRQLLSLIGQLSNTCQVIRHILKEDETYPRWQRSYGGVYSVN